jgi:hypothetical protein
MKKWQNTFIVSSQIIRPPRKQTHDHVISSYYTMLNHVAHYSVGQYMTSGIAIHIEFS